MGDEVDRLPREKGMGDEVNLKEREQANIIIDCSLK